jgi:predicted NAD-dependent protein-ADP-ribosyltransferase YbiA (DUF1768 family)
MKILCKGQMLILVPETDIDAGQLEAWKEGRENHVFSVSLKGSGLLFGDLGVKEHACNEPLNVSSNATDPAAKLISNFAAAPFELDGRTYRSVESFWQGLKCEDRLERRLMAEMDGPAARRKGEALPYGETIGYEGERIVVGAWRHWELMDRACWAKFTQNIDARDALLSTGQRTLTHRVRRDSKTIPGAIMADIWMKIRRKLQKIEEREEEVQE